MATPARPGSGAADLIIAKAALSASLFSSGVARSEVEDALNLLNRVTTECSSGNVQQIKYWALKNVVPSNSGAALFGKYLVALSKSFTLDETGGPKTKPSANRRRLHLLYILNDILFHVKYRVSDFSFFANIEPHLAALFRSAASFKDRPKHTKKVLDLIGIWEEKRYFPAEVTEKLRQVTEKAAMEGDSTNDETQKASQGTRADPKGRKAPWIMPALHGNPTTPWYDLPAGCMLPAMELFSDEPIQPALIKPVQLDPGPVTDKNLIAAVEKTLLDVDRIYGEDDGVDDDSRFSIGPLGERVELDEKGNIINGENYYGWSFKFCKMMKQRDAQREARRELDELGREVEGMLARTCASGRDFGRVAGS